MKQQINAVLSKQMDRKDFLKSMAAAAFVVAGGNVMLQSLGSIEKFGDNSASSGPKGVAIAGYGASVYGGNQNR